MLNLKGKAKTIWCPKQQAGQCTGRIMGAKNWIRTRRQGLNQVCGILPGTTGEVSQVGPMYALPGWVVSTDDPFVSASRRKR